MAPTYVSHPRSLWWVNRIALVFVLIIAGIVRLFRLGYRSLWIDEIGQVWVAQLSFPRFWKGVMTHHGAAPLDYLITKAMLIVGQSDFILRLPAAIWGILAVYWTYRLARRWYSSSTGLLAAGFLALNFFHLTYSQELRFYALFVFLTLLSTEGFLWAWERGGSAWIGYGMISLLLLYSHYYGAFVLGLHGLWAVGACLWPLDSSKSWLSQFKHFMVTLVVIALLFLPWVIYDVPHEKGFGIKTPIQLSWDLLETTIKTLLGWEYGLGIILLLILSGYIYLFLREKTIALGLGVWMGSLLPIVVYLDYRFAYFFHPRQVIFVLPFLLILLAGGIDGWIRGLFRLLPNPSLSSHHWLHAVILGGFLLAWCWYSLPRLQQYYISLNSHEDWKGASAVLQDNMQALDILVFPSPLERNYIRYYLPEPLWKPSRITSTIEDFHQVALNGAPVWILFTSHSDKQLSHEEKKQLAHHIEQLGAIPFTFNDRFKLYFFWPNQTQEAYQTRARTWHAPPRLHWWMVIGKAMSQSGAHDAALEAYANAANLPDFPSQQADALIQAGNEAMMLQRPDLALTFFTKASEKDRHNVQAQVHQARALLQLNRPQEAVSILLQIQANQEKPDYWVAWFLGRGYEAMQQWDAAIEAYQQALLLHPNTKHLSYFIAHAYEAKGDWQKAQIWYQIYLAHDPQGAFAAAAIKALNAH